MATNPRSPAARREATRRRLVAEFVAENADEVRSTIVASWNSLLDPEEVRAAIVASWNEQMAIDEAEMRRLLRQWLDDQNQRSIVASLEGRDRRAAQYQLTRWDKRRAEREALLASPVSADDLEAAARPTPRYAEGTDPDGEKRGRLLLARAERLKKLRESLGYTSRRPSAGLRTRQQIASTDCEECE